MPNIPMNLNAEISAMNWFLTSKNLIPAATLPANETVEKVVKLLTNSQLFLILFWITSF